MNFFKGLINVVILATEKKALATMLLAKRHLQFHGGLPPSLPHPSSFINLKFTTPTLTLRKIVSLPKRP